MSKSGTEWVAAGQGSTVRQLFACLGGQELVCEAGRAHKALGRLKGSTNLRLTGAPITEEDWARLESAEFKVGE